MTAVAFVDKCHKIVRRIDVTFLDESAIFPSMIRVRSRGGRLPTKIEYEKSSTCSLE